MKKILVSMVLASGILVAQAQEKTIHDDHAVRRNVGEFHSISVGGGIDLYLSQGDAAVAVSASSSKEIDHIITEVVNGELRIRYEFHGVMVSFGDKHLKAYVSAKDLDRLHAGGGSDLYVEGGFHARKLELSLSGGSDGKGELEAETLRVDISGGSDAHFTGRAADLIVVASGGSDFHGEKFAADHATATATGGSDVYVTVNKELDAHASGGSDVYYSGSGTVRELQASGGSSVKKRS